MPILNAGYRYTIDQLKRILRTDPVLPIAHLEYRRDLTSDRSRVRLSQQEWLNLCHDSQLHIAMHHTTLTKGSRNPEKHFFACASSKTAKLTHWNMRQLSGMAGVRFCLGIHPNHWELTALNRTNTPNQAIPDAIIHLEPRDLPIGKKKRSWYGGLTYLEDIAVEWDSGSAVRTQLEFKVLAYKAVAQYQIWVAPTFARAETLQDVCHSVLEDASIRIGILVVDWRTGLCSGSSLPKRGTYLSKILETTMREVHDKWYWS